MITLYAVGGILALLAITYVLDRAQARRIKRREMREERMSRRLGELTSELRRVRRRFRDN
jgi:hypothetical protein